MIMDTAVAVAGASGPAADSTAQQKHSASALGSAASEESSNKKSDGASEAADEVAKSVTILQASSIPNHAVKVINTHTLMPVHVAGDAVSASSQFINRITTTTVPFTTSNASAAKLTISATSTPASVFSNGSSSSSAANFASMAPSAINNLVKTLINSSSSAPSSASTTSTSTSASGNSAGSNGKLLNNHPLVATLMNAPSSNMTPVAPSSNLPTITKLSAPNASSTTTNSSQKIVLTTTTASSAAASRFLASSPSQLGASMSPLMPVALNNIAESTASGSTSAIPIALNSNIKAIPINLKSSNMIPASPAASLHPSSTSATISALNAAHSSAGAINIKSLSPLPFMNENVSTTSTKINTTSVRNLPTTVAQGASISTGSSAQPATQTLSSYIKSTTTTANTTATGFHHPGGTSIHKMTSLSQPSSSAHTIAQICSTLGSVPGSSGPPSAAQTNAILSAIQPIRFLPNPSHSSVSSSAHSSGSTGITTSTITLTNPVAMATAQPLNAVNVLNNATSSLINSANVNTNLSATAVSQSTSSPSSSPMKPNIIRKPKRDSPAPSTLSEIYQLSSGGTVVKDIKPPKFEISTADKPYEQISLAASSLGFHSVKHGGGLNVANVKELSMTDHNKNLRKIMLTNSSVLNSSSATGATTAPASAFVHSANISPPQPSQTTVSLVASSGNSVLLQTVVPFSSLAHTHQHANSTGFDSSPANSSSSSSSSDALTATASSSASRKRRKQEIKKQGEETTVSYNPNPLSNNNALAYANASMLARPVASGENKMSTQSSTDMSRTLRPVYNETGSMNGATTGSKYLDEDDDAIYDSDEEVSTSASNAAKHPPSKIPRLCPPATATAFTRAEENLTVKSEQIESKDVEMRSSDDEACLDDEEVQRLSKDFRYLSSNGLSWAAKKCKPTAVLNKVYKTNWKARSYHYLRYSDIKAKDLPVTTTPNTINQRELTDNLNEWKFHYVINQVNNLINYENESLQLIQDIQDLVDASTKICNYSDLYVKISESIKANSQRHRFVNEQLDEVHILIRKLFEHKEKFKNVLLVSAASKNSSSSSASGSKALGQSTGQSKPKTSVKLTSVVPQALRKNMRANKNINTRSSNLQSKSITTTASKSASKYS